MNERDESGWSWIKATRSASRARTPSLIIFRTRSHGRAVYRAPQGCRRGIAAYSELQLVAAVGTRWLCTRDLIFSAIRHCPSVVSSAGPLDGDIDHVQRDLSLAECVGSEG